MSSMRHQNSGQRRHLILKLRWIGLEDEALRLQLAVGTPQLKAPLPDQAYPPMPTLSKTQTPKEKLSLRVGTEGKRAS